MVVRGEEHAAANVIGEVADYGRRNGRAVERRRAAAQLVKQHQRLLGREAQNVRRLAQLHEERALPCHNAVAGAQAREDTVHGGHGAAFGGHKAAHLSHLLW